MNVEEFRRYAAKVPTTSSTWDVFVTDRNGRNPRNIVGLELTSTPDDTGTLKIMTSDSSD